MLSLLLVLIFLWCLRDLMLLFLFSCYGDHRDLHVRTHSFPTRHSSDLQVRALQPILLQQRHKPVHLVFNFDGLMEERCDMETAISRLKRLCVAQTAPRSRRIFTRRLPLDTLASSEDFNIPMIAWHERGGDLPSPEERLVGTECVRK